MAWNIRWTTTFKSIEGNTYTANIYDKNYSGVPVELIPDANPFSTMENNDSNAFTVIRAQTGYLRVIVDNPEIIEEIIPAEPFSRLIKVFKGNNLEWIGFLSKKNYKQPYLGYKWSVDFALLSILSMLKYIEYPYAAGILPLHKIIGNVLGKLYNMAETEPSKVVVLNPIYMANGVVKPEVGTYYPLNDDYQLENPSLSGMFLKASIGPLSSWFTERKITMPGRQFTHYCGSSCDIVISDILQSFCAVIRENADEIIIGLFHNTGTQYNLRTFTFENFCNDLDTFSPGTSVGVNINFNNVEDNCSIDYIYGKNNTEVSLEPDLNEINIWNLPATVHNPNIVADLSHPSPTTDSFRQYPWDIYANDEEFNFYNLNGTKITSMEDIRRSFLGLTGSDIIHGALPLLHLAISNGEIYRKFTGLELRPDATSYPDYHSLYKVTFNIPNGTPNGIVRISLKDESNRSAQFDIIVINNGDYYDGFFKRWDNSFRYCSSINRGNGSYLFDIDVENRSGQFDVVFIGLKDGEASRISKLSISIFDTTKLHTEYNYVDGFEFSEKNFYMKNYGEDNPEKNNISLKIGTFQGNKLAPNFLRVDDIFLYKLSVKGQNLTVEEILCNTMSEYYNQRREILTATYHNYPSLSKKAIYKKDGKKYIAIVSKYDYQEEKKEVRYIELVN